MLEVWGHRSVPEVFADLEIELPDIYAGVERWILYRALREREAFRTHIMIPFGELRGRLLDA